MQLVGCPQYVEGSLSQQLGFTKRLAPTVVAVTPNTGSSAGGTGVQIDGSGWGRTRSLVSIAGIPAEVVWVGGQNDAWTSPQSGTEYRCRASLSCAVVETGNHGPTLPVNGPSGGYVSVVVVDDGRGVRRGAALADDAAFFSYVDLWSLPSTWGGKAPPNELDTVVIPEGQNVVLDVSPPKLYMLLVFGSLTFMQAPGLDLHLQVGYVFVYGGAFTIGTEEQPFEQNAVVTLYGNPVSQELPIYGAKLIGCRECTLDLHGKPTSRTWTTLAQTAQSGDLEIRLSKNVDWEVGAQVVI